MTFTISDQHEYSTSMMDNSYYLYGSTVASYLALSAASAHSMHASGTERTVQETISSIFGTLLLKCKMVENYEYKPFKSCYEIDNS